MPVRRYEIHTATPSYLHNLNGDFSLSLLQVSFFSTSPELSNKQRFEYFTRTIPSDHYQVKAMVDIVLTMGWSYVSIIYEESNYGIKVNA
ncbi:Metabotropic glutamate receptor [Ooceraea biroi]|uniref:Metabotropic glutamate receptor n=1 Tax=Ooceraea biroi TaxID=2015173 RepID=A0A026VTZ8_OOCBI|nr:Metabotropic glutamate receptor [Ooceraea biroi]